MKIMIVYEISTCFSHVLFSGLELSYLCMYRVKLNVTRFP